MQALDFLRRTTLGLAGAAMLAVGGGAWATQNTDADGVVLHGYDPVAYFTAGAPTEGSADYTASYDGGTYRFASAENRDLFVADPAKYAPAYGGFCAFGTAMGFKVDIDPEAWSIVDDKLYVNLNKGVQERWQGNPHGFIETADHNWPIIADVSGDQLQNAPPEGVRQGAAQ